MGSQGGEQGSGGISIRDVAGGADLLFGARICHAFAIESIAALDSGKPLAAALGPEASERLRLLLARFAGTLHALVDADFAAPVPELGSMREALRSAPTLPAPEGATTLVPEGAPEAEVLAASLAELLAQATTLAEAAKRYAGDAGGAALPHVEALWGFVRQVREVLERHQAEWLRALLPAPAMSGAELLERVEAIHAEGRELFREGLVEAMAERDRAPGLYEVAGPDAVSRRACPHCGGVTFTPGPPRPEAVHRCAGCGVLATAPVMPIVPATPAEAAGPRPDYVHCALTGAFDRPVDHPLGPHREQKTWCGRKDPPESEFVFLDASHAVLSAKQGGRLLLCPDCAREMRAALDTGTWEPPADPAVGRTRRNRASADALRVAADFFRHAYQAVPVATVVSDLRAMADEVEQGRPPVVGSSGSYVAPSENPASPERPDIVPGRVCPQCGASTFSQARVHLGGERLWACANCGAVSSVHQMPTVPPAHAVTSARDINGRAFCHDPGGEGPAPWGPIVTHAVGNLFATALDQNEKPEVFHRLASELGAALRRRILLLGEEVRGPSAAPQEPLRQALAFLRELALAIAPVFRATSGDPQERAQAVLDAIARGKRQLGRLMEGLSEKERDIIAGRVGRSWAHEPLEARFRELLTKESGMSLAHAGELATWLEAHARGWHIQIENPNRSLCEASAALSRALVRLFPLLGKRAVSVRAPLPRSLDTETQERIVSAAIGAAREITSAFHHFEEADLTEVAGRLGAGLTGHAVGKVLRERVLEKADEASTRATPEQKTLFLRVLGAALRGDRVCVGCGCTDMDACVVGTSHVVARAHSAFHAVGACHWVDEGLCSACAQERAPS